MATWRQVRTDYVVSTEGKSASFDIWSGIIRYDTSKGWVDLCSSSVREEGITARVWLPIPDESHWRKIGDVVGEAITVEDIAQIRIDIEAAFVIWRGRCSFLDAAYLY